MASPGTTVIAGKYVSAWGGIQSAGQTVGQIVSTSEVLKIKSQAETFEDTDSFTATAIRHRGLWKKNGLVHHLGGPRYRKWIELSF